MPVCFIFPAWELPGRPTPLARPYLGREGCRGQGVGKRSVAEGKIRYMTANSQVERQTASAMQSRRASTLRLIPELDGVRGIAVLLVMLCHSSLIQPMPVFEGL